MGDGDSAVGADARVVVLRKLHKKTTKEELQAFASQFGPVVSINVWYGWGQAIIELNEEGAAALLTACRDTPAQIRGKLVVVRAGVAARADQLYKQSPANPIYVQKEIARCVADVCKLVEVKAIRSAANELRGRFGHACQSAGHLLAGRLDSSCSSLIHLVRCQPSTTR